MFKKYVLAVGYLIVLMGMLDLPCHKMFHICVNPINILVCHFNDKNPNTFGNQAVGVGP